MTNRRELIRAAMLAALGVAVTRPSIAAAAATMRMRPIPATGEMLPVIGMGSSGSFEVGPGPEREALREVIRRFLAGGGRLIDTAPTYSNAEDVLGELLADANARAQCFIATKLSGVSGHEAGRAQFEASLVRLRTDHVELLQVHNLGDWKTQLELARELQKEGRVKYVGLTHFRDSAHEELAAAVAASRPDFLQINYSVTQRAAAERVLPLARDLGVAVLANRNFDDGALFARVADKPVPAWAMEAGITSWAQLFLKFALSHPAVTTVIPATGKPHRQSDNIKAGHGPDLDGKQRRALIAALSS